MSEIDVLKRTADVVTDRIINVEIPIKSPSWIDKLLKRPDVRVFEVRRSCLGALINFSRHVLVIQEIVNISEMNVPKIISVICADGEILITCLAILIEDTIKEPSESLKQFIRINLDTTDSKAVLYHLLNHSKFEDFMSSIILVKGMSLLKPEEIIAPEKKASGAPLEEQ